MVLSVLSRFTASDYHFGICIFFLIEDQAEDFITPMFNVMTGLVTGVKNCRGMIPVGEASDCNFGIFGF